MGTIDMEQMALREAATEVFHTKDLREVERRPDGMKTITVNIPDDIYRDLRQAMAVRGMSGEAVGLPDQFMFRLITLIDEGKAVHTFERRPRVVDDPIVKPAP